MTAHHALLSRLQAALLKHGAVLLAALLSLACMWQLGALLSQLDTALWQTWTERTADSWQGTAHHTPLAHKLRLGGHVAYSLLLTLWFALWAARFGAAGWSTQLQRIGWAAAALAALAVAAAGMSRLGLHSHEHLLLPLLCIGWLVALIAIARRDLSRLSALLLLPMLYPSLRLLSQLYQTDEPTSRGLALLTMAWCGAMLLVIALRRGDLGAWLGRTMLAAAAALVLFTGWITPQVNHELAHYYTNTHYTGALCGQSVVRWLHRVEGDLEDPARAIHELGGRQYFFGPHAGDKGQVERW